MTTRSTKGRTTKKQNRRVRFINWVIVVAWAGVIWALSSIPDLKSGLEQDFILRKLAHGFEFAVLTILILRALPRPKSGTWLRLVGAGILALEYAAIDEIHQGFVPGREPSIRDVGIDALGVIAGLLLFSLASALYQKNKK